MEFDPEIAASQEQIAANRKLIDDTEQKVEQLNALMQEFRQLYAQQQGIAPEEVEAYLAKHMPGDELAKLKAQFEQEIGADSTAALPEAAPQSTAGTRRPRRNIV